MSETKKILAVMSEWGYWGIELVGPLKKLEAAGYSFDFITPKGKRSPVLPPSVDTTYVDPPLGVCGPIVDMVNNQRVHDLILGFWNKKMPIGAICYGVAPLVFARDFNERKAIIRGKHVTGHCLEYDYHDGTGFVGTDFNMGPPPYTLEYILRDATAPGGAYHGNFGK